jgi:hypothetical protein
VCLGVVIYFGSVGGGKGMGRRGRGSHGCSHKTYLLSLLPVSFLRLSLRDNQGHSSRRESIAIFEVQVGRGEFMAGGQSEAR